MVNLLNKLNYMRDINSAGFDPSVEDVGVDESNVCEDCGGELIMKLTSGDEIYYKCNECGVIV